MKAIFPIILFILFLFSCQLSAQDFILQGCYWSCPEDDPESSIDSSSFSYWTERMQQQATELAYAGFTQLWLPPLNNAPVPVLQSFIKSLQHQNISPIAAVKVRNDSIGSFYQQAKRLQDSLGINHFSLYNSTQLAPFHISNGMNQLQDEGNPAAFIVTELGMNFPVKKAAAWINDVTSRLNYSPALESQARVYDFSLRESLRKACTMDEYDVRAIFAASLRDASSLSGFNTVIFVNHPQFKNQNGNTGDMDDLLSDPMLAYAYILSNNQLGLPAVFYGDYYGVQSELEEYIDETPLKTAIDQLIKTHQSYIYGATAVEYLNRIGSDRATINLLPASGADSTRYLIFQLDGTNTVKGNNNRPKGNKDVIVAINFSRDTLLIQQEINMANVAPKDYFTDVIGNALEERSELKEIDSIQSGLNSIIIGLPPRSYSIWVQGRAYEVIPSRISLETSGYENYIEINWETAFESNVYGYELERSVDGKPYEKISSMRALSGSSDPASYMFFDKDVYPEEKLYYRVKLLDKDGGYEYSPVEKASLFRRQLTFEWIPAQQTKKANLLINSNAPAVTNIRVYDASGKEVLQQEHNIKKGSNQATLNLNNLKAGVYFVRLKIGNQQWWSQRVVVR
ncbi:MAG: T9SS type A sorting domain-containing protein [Chitinophagales bacterium]|nr:T9SS type A sorting domain-containing protein [Chitinophagales bacterium]